jgi:DNA-3-methyladenine glycosylase I
LEGFQAGLSWRLVLERRPALRAALCGFDPIALAQKGPDDIDAILGMPGVIRHRGKVAAVIANAQATLALRGVGGGLAGLIWAHRPRTPRSPIWPPPARTPEADALAAALRRAGFRFIGPTTAYALMQSCGLVNDHGPDCPVRAEVEEAQRHIAERP